MKTENRRLSAQLLTRRMALEVGLLAGASTVLPVGAFAGDSAPQPITRAIPSTGERIPVIGIGTDRFGNASVEEVQAVLQRMSQFGGIMIDTAALYQGSEEQIGPALKSLDLRSKVFLSSKMNAAGAVNDPPKPPVSRHGVDPVNGIDSFNRSLERLQTTTIDLMMAHWLSSVDTLMPLLVDLKRQGKIRYIGITTVSAGQYPRIAVYMRKYPVDFVQVEYSLTERSAETELFPLAMDKKIAISVARPFGGDNSPLFRAVMGRELPAWAAEYDIGSWAQMFLKYIVSHPAVTCVVPGSTNPVYTEDNQRAGFGRLPDPAGRLKIEALFA